MQSKPNIGVILIASVAMFLLGACGGGSTGAAWFNLPSIPVRVQSDGTAKVFGVNLGPVLAPAQVQQLQGANVQELEARVGYDGIHIYNNGQLLPYVAWSEDSVDTLQNVLTNLPPELGVDGSQIAPYLPMLRQYGLGVLLDVAPAEGAEEIDVAPWNGTPPAVTPSEGGEPSVALSFGSLYFDAEGNAYIEGMPVSQLEEAMGTSLGLNLDANTLSMLQSLNLENIQIQTTPAGIIILYNGEPLPGIAYDAEKLTSVVGVAAPFLGDEATAQMLNDVVTMLPGTSLDLGVSFTGEPSGVETTLPSIDITVAEDGSLSAMGMPLGSGAMLPADVLAQLSEAGVQYLDIDMSGTGLVLAVNGEVLPMLSWTEESLNTIINGVVQPMLGEAGGAMGGAMGIVTPLLDRSPLDVSLALPGASGEAPGEIDTTMVTPELGDIAPPVIRADATFANGELQSLSEISAESLDALGVVPPTLPPNVLDILNNLNAETVELVTSPNQLDINVNGSLLLSLIYDAPSLGRALNLAAPFAPDSPLQNEALMTLVQEQILPLVPGSDVDVTLHLQ